MAYEEVNAKVVKARVRPGQHVLARRGAMLAYTGEVTFHPVHGGGGPAGMLGRAMAGESVPMMAAEGDGEVWYGYRGLHAVVIDLDGSEQLTVESDRLMLHDGSLQSSVVFLGSQGGVRGAVRGAVSGQGLFTTQLAGVGSVAVLAHGGVIPLPVDGRQVSVDPQAYVCHAGAITVDLSAKVGWREAVGKGSGEAFQLRMTGSGTVFVQASERKL